MSKISNAIQQFFQYLHQFAHRIWYLPLISFLAALDLFIFLVPTDTFLITAVMVRPREKWKIATYFTSASAIGAVIMAWASEYMGEWLRVRINDLGFTTELWTRLEVFIQNWGGIALAAHAAGPFPLQPGVILAAAGGMNLFLLFFAVWVGRALKYFFFAWAAAYAPEILEKYFFIRVNETLPNRGLPE